MKIENMLILTHILCRACYTLNCNGGHLELWIIHLVKVLKILFNGGGHLRTILFNGGGHLRIILFNGGGHLRIRAATTTLSY
jgi:hypothetical protein